MGWEIGESEGRDVGYGVPAICEHPYCDKRIDRGLAHVCGGMHGSSDGGCGRYFCGDHLFHGCFGMDEMTDEQIDEADTNQICVACAAGQEPYPMKPDTLDWVSWKLNDESWQQWRDENPDEVAKMRERLAKETA